jgi:uncharacterized protein (TIGR03437 family)
LDRLKATLIAAFVIVILFAPAASADVTAAKVTVVSGNGQMICKRCIGKIFSSFYPMVVKVTDANGNPIQNKTVTWQQVAPFSFGGAPSFDDTTTTDSNGLAISRLFPAPVEVFASATQPPILQYNILATADTTSVTFTETQALVRQDGLNTAQVIFAILVTDFGTVLSGPAGSKGAIPIQVHIDGFPVSGVSVRILSPEVTSATGQVTIDPALPSASCDTGPGADPGSVLTDANGNASCTPVFGPAAGSGPVSVLIGGLDPAQFDYSTTALPLTDPIAFDEKFRAINLVVTPVTPGRVTIVSGNTQSVNPGQSSAPLVVQVTDGTGTVTIANQNVAWTVSPAGLATVSPTSSLTNSLGQAQTTVSFAPNASGPITVRAALANNSAISTTFNLTTNVQIASLTKVSGDLQTTQSGQNFGAPLVVQVNGTNGQPLSGQQVSFLVSNGTATLSAISAFTDGNGQVKITVTAGSVPGPVAIRAIIGNFFQTFTLTIIPPGPSLSSGSFVNAGGATRIAALSPCSLVTVIASGLAPNVQGMVFNTNAFGPWATTLAADTVTVNNVPAPIYSVGNVNNVEQLTFQVPCETALANSVPITINVAGGTATITFPVVAASPGIFETVMSDGARRAVAVRPDGTFVSLQNPARRGETVRVFVTGLGPTSPTMVSGSVPVPGVDSLAFGQVIVGINNSGAGPNIARVSPNLIGVYEVSFQVPSDAPTGNDVVLSVAVNAPGDSQTRFSNGSKLPIQ